MKIFTGICTWFVCFLHNDFLCFFVDYDGDWPWHGQDSHDPLKKDDMNVTMTNLQNKVQGNMLNDYLNT